MRVIGAKFLVWSDMLHDPKGCHFLVVGFRKRVPTCMPDYTSTIRVLCPSDTKRGHFGNVLPIQQVSLVPATQITK